MPIMHINSASLNLRSEPLIKPATIIKSLPFGHPVNVTGEAEKEGWKTVTTTYQGKNLSGVLSGDFLRAPLSAAKENLLAAGAIEWDRFERGAGKEEKSPFFKFVGEMWANVGRPDLDGKNGDVPWSAACISFIVKNAGYKKFKPDAAHAVYIHDAIVARENDNSNKDYWGFRLTEHKPTFGDLVCRNRNGGSITYNSAKKAAGFISHTDIVVAVGKDYADAVGGNVKNSVSVTRYKLKSNGFLDPEDGRQFAVLRNNN
jgi:hypothetical protein